MAKEYTIIQHRERYNGTRVTEINGVWMKTECTLAEVKAELSKREVKA